MEITKNKVELDQVDAFIGVGGQIGSMRDHVKELFINRILCSMEQKSE
jgi:hypothetical protein